MRCNGCDLPLASGAFCRTPPYTFSPLPIPQQLYPQQSAPALAQQAPIGHFKQPISNEDSQAIEEAAAASTSADWLRKSMAGSTFHTESRPSVYPPRQRWSSLVTRTQSEPDQNPCPPCVRRCPPLNAPAAQRSVMGIQRRQKRSCYSVLTCNRDPKRPGRLYDCIFNSKKAKGEIKRRLATPIPWDKLRARFPSPLIPSHVQRGAERPLVPSAPIKVSPTKSRFGAAVFRGSARGYEENKRCPRYLPFEPKLPSQRPKVPMQNYSIGEKAPNHITDYDKCTSENAENRVTGYNKSIDEIAQTCVIPYDDSMCEIAEDGIRRYDSVKQNKIVSGLPNGALVLPKPRPRLERSRVKTRRMSSVPVKNKHGCGSANKR